MKLIKEIRNTVIRSLVKNVFKIGLQKILEFLDFGGKGGG